MFAAAYLNNAVHVYNFYTLDSPAHYKYTGHTQKVRSIDWWENDLGFVSSSQGGDTYFWDMINQ